MHHVIVTEEGDWINQEFVSNKNTLRLTSTIRSIYINFMLNNSPIRLVVAREMYEKFSNMLTRSIEKAGIPMVASKQVDNFLGVDGEIYLWSVKLRVL